jgi:peptide deformylase
MNTLELKTYPDPCLRIKTRLVEDFNQDIKAIVKGMSDLMYLSQGIGLAATQVGLGLSVLVIDTGEGLKAFINPEILEKSKKKSCIEEGCLSLPGVSVRVSRPAEIKVRARDESGEYFAANYAGIMATALQHEMDHLEGRLLIDHLDPVRRFFAKKKLARIKKMGGGGKTCQVICHA